MLFRAMKNKPTLPKCTECGVDLIPHPHLDPRRTLCVMDAMKRGVIIERVKE